MVLRERERDVVTTMMGGHYLNNNLTQHIGQDAQSKKAQSAYNT